MSDTPRPSRRVPFTFEKELEELDSAINQQVKIHIDMLRRDILSAENMQRLKHGRRWRVGHSDDSGSGSELKQHSTEVTIPFKTIIDHDTGTLEKYLLELPNRMHQLLMRNLIDVLDDSTKRSGNVVSGGDFKEKLPEILRKIKFGVDRWGAPSPPQLICHPELEAKLAGLASDAAFREEIDGIMELKMKEALVDEAYRISHYKFR